jgi:hypothetical protein
MGTRNLTMVINNSETKVAQYGQHDGYPAGQGKTVLEFLQKCDLEKFKKVLEKVSFIDPEESGGDERIPGLNINTAANILQLIYDGKATKLFDSSEFAKNSLFCRWAYVIDLDKELLEVYKGYNKEPLGDKDRFFHDGYNDDEYYPVKIAQSYSLYDLPELEKFIDDLSPGKSKNLGLSK